MPTIDNIITTILIFLPLLFTVTGLIILLWGAHRFIIVRNTGMGNERMLPKQLIMLGLTFASIVIIVLVLPVSDATRNQILVLIGIALSGIFAFSSTTIFANLMAGIMLRVTKPFETGDYITIGDHSGRVAERGLLDTEIQTEDRRLVAFPNTFMITNPVSVVRSSGTIVAVTLTLGYETHYSHIESLLLEAATKSGLEDPFIQILELGNFAITYKASGMLNDVKVYLTAHSNLRRHILDTLHNNDIEIVSPGFMNQRQLSDKLKFIPTPVKQKPAEQTAIAEEVVFDKAEQAEQIEVEKKNLVASIQQLEEDLKNEISAEEKKYLKEKIKTSREQLKLFGDTNSETD